MRETLEWIRREFLLECSCNPRRNYDQGRLDALAESLRDRGVLQPLVVRNAGGGLHEVVCGHSRLRAAEIAGLEALPCMVRELSDREVAELVLAENLQRADLTPLEEALGVEALSRAGATQDEVAEVCGRSPAWVQLRLDLLGLPDPVKEDVHARRVAIGTAMALRVVDDARKGEAWEQLVHPAFLDRPMTPKEAHAWVAEKYVEPARREKEWAEVVMALDGRLERMVVASVDDAGLYLTRGRPSYGFAAANEMVPEHLLRQGRSMKWCKLADLLGVPVVAAPHFDSLDDPHAVMVVEVGKVEEADEARWEAARSGKKIEWYMDHKPRMVFARDDEDEPGPKDRGPMPPAVEAAQQLLVALLMVVEGWQTALEQAAERLEKAEDPLGQLAEESAGIEWLVRAMSVMQPAKMGAKWDKCESLRLLDEMKAAVAVPEKRKARKSK